MRVWSRTRNARRCQGGSRAGAAFARALLAPPQKFATGKCLVRHISAPPVALVCPAVRAPAGTKTRTQALTDFSRALKAGEVRAVVAADDEKALEGNFWLAELLSESYAIDEDC